MDGLSASDVALLGKEADGMGGGSSFMWIFALLILLFGGGFNGFGNRNGYTDATTNEILSGQRFDSLARQINQVGDGICSSTYATSQQINGVQSGLGSAITTEGRAIQTQLANCCCENQRNTDALRYEMANAFASTNANTTAQTQKILDAITGNRMADMQSQINQLQLQSAMCGVVRYPMASTYSSGGNPFCGGCNCNI